MTTQLFNERFKGYELGVEEYKETRSSEVLACLVELQAIYDENKDFEMYEIDEEGIRHYRLRDERIAV